jgi:hypothetical protein
MPKRGENDDHNMSMRNHVQRKFLNDMIDSTGKSYIDQITLFYELEVKNMILI